MAFDLTSWLATAKWTWENRTEIRTILRELRSWFTKSNEPNSTRKILIVGPGGVGKTTLSKMISGDYDWLEDNTWQYDESAGRDDKTLASDSKTPFVVLPGQPVRRDPYWVHAERDIVAGSVAGIILVTANGYHSPSVTMRNHPLFTGKKAAFRAAYVEEGRLDEVAVYDRLGPAIKACPKKLWILSLATKVDLYADDIATVNREWTDGRFAKHVQDWITHRGVERFHHESLTACLIISRLTMPDGEVLVSNQAGYDTEQSVKSIRRLFEVLAALKAWGESQ